MKNIYLFLLLLITASACNEHQSNEDLAEREMTIFTKFDKSKWSIKDGKDYPYRDQMLNAVVYNDTIRTLDKDQILELLGEPDYYRDDGNFLHYRITESRLSYWTLHTKTMVVKLTDNNAIEWIKIHE